MRILATLTVIALLAAPAHAQTPTPGGQPTTLSQQRAAKPTTAPPADEQAYKDALKRVPVSTEKPDPWKTMR